ncbi:MAG: hypothetical protein NVS2B14_22030 [Chamaesiphon sp.]
MLRTKVIGKAKGSHLSGQADYIPDCVSVAKPEKGAAKLSVFLPLEVWDTYNSDLIQ